MLGAKSGCAVCQLEGELDALVFTAGVGENSGELLSDFSESQPQAATTVVHLPHPVVGIVGWFCNDVRKRADVACAACAERIRAMVCQVSAARQQRCCSAQSLAHKRQHSASSERVAVSLCRLCLYRCMHARSRSLNPVRCCCDCRGLAGLGWSWTRPRTRARLA